MEVGSGAAPGGGDAGVLPMAGVPQNASNTAVIRSDELQELPAIKCTALPVSRAVASVKRLTMRVRPGA